MQSRSMLPLYYCPFSAYDLDGIKEPVPYTDAGHGKGSKLGTLHGLKNVGPYNEAHQTGYDGGHGKYLPVVLKNEHPEKLAQIYKDL